MRFVGDVQLAEGSELQNAAIATGTTFPAFPTPGELFFRSDIQDIFYYHNNVWASLSAASDNIQEVNEILSQTSTIKSIIYDTTKDSDTGNWTNETSHTSWYSEIVPSGVYKGRHADLAAAINSGTAENDWYARTGTSEFFRMSGPSTEVEIFRAGVSTFPKLSLIVIESDKLIIYNLTEQIPQMWMVFSPPSSDDALYLLAASSTMPYVAVDMVEGVLVVGVSDSSTNGTLYVLDFYNDVEHLYDVSGKRQHYNNIAGRSLIGSATIANGTRALVGDIITGVAMYAYDDAILNINSGLKIPSIAVSNFSGISFIRDNGLIYDSLQTFRIDTVSFTGNGTLLSTKGISAWDVFHSVSVPTSDGWNLSDYNFANNASSTLRISNTTKAPSVVGLGDDFAIGTTDGLHIIHSERIVPTNSLFSTITTISTSGWITGGTVAAWFNGLGPTVDVSSSNNALTMTGTVTSAPVSAGAELLAYSGFSSTDYLSKSYDSDFDFGLADFSLSVWVNIGITSATDTIFVRGDYSAGWTGSAIRLHVTTSGNIQFIITNDGFSTTDSITGIPSLDDFPGGQWKHVTIVRENSTINMYLDGGIIATSTITNAALTLDNASAAVHVGIDPSLTDGFGGLLSLFRIAKAKLTAADVRYMFNTEKHLFTENAKGFVSGTSNGVVALAYDGNKKYLHVGTSWGRSVFDGLENVGNEATLVGVPNSIAVHGGLISNSGTGGMDIFIPTMNVRRNTLLDHLNNTRIINDDMPEVKSCYSQDDGCYYR